MNAMIWAAAHVGLAMLVSGCAPEADTADATGMSENASTDASPTGSPVPKVFAATAWRATSDDGARFTTYLDSDGRYRDVRNGDPWQSGTWRFDTSGGGLLCFKPEGEDGTETCWKPDRMHGDTMDASDEKGRQIELRRVEYVAPDSGDDKPA